jgi:hypothetical protein
MGFEAPARRIARRAAVMLLVAGAATGLGASLAMLAREVERFVAPAARAPSFESTVAGEEER